MPQTPEEFEAEIEAHIAGLKTEIAEINARTDEIQAEERQRRFREIIDPIMGCTMYLAYSVIPIILLIAFFKSIAWVVEVLLPILAWVGVIGLLLVPVFLLLAIPRVTRAWAGLGLTLSSYAIGIGIWVWSFVIAYALAGVFWMVVGLFFAGIGVVAVAAIASALHGECVVHP